MRVVSLLNSGAHMETEDEVTLLYLLYNSRHTVISASVHKETKSDVAPSNVSLIHGVGHYSLPLY